jgi:hypothetical protein
LDAIETFYACELILMLSNDSLAKFIVAVFTSVRTNAISPDAILGVVKSFIEKKANYLISEMTMGVEVHEGTKEAVRIQGIKLQLIEKSRLNPNYIDRSIQAHPFQLFPFEAKLDTDA